MVIITPPECQNCGNNLKVILLHPKCKHKGKIYSFKIWFCEKCKYPIGMDLWYNMIDNGELKVVGENGCN